MAVQKLGAAESCWWLKNADVCLFSVSWFSARGGGKWQCNGDGDVDNYNNYIPSRLGGSHDCGMEQAKCSCAITLPFKYWRCKYTFEPLLTLVCFIFFYGPRIFRYLLQFPVLSKTRVDENFWRRRKLIRKDWTNISEILQSLASPGLTQPAAIFGQIWELNPSLRNWRFSQILLGAEFQFEELEIWSNPKILIQFEELGIRSNHETLIQFEEWDIWSSPGA